MALAATGTKRRWLVSAIGAALVIAVLLLLFRVPVREGQPIPGATPPGAIRLSPRRSDELVIRDPAPLFLPTRYNAQPPELASPRPGAKFLDEDAVRPKFAETDPRLHLPAAIQAPQNATEVLSDVPGPLASGFGQTAVAVQPIEAHAAFVQVFAGSTGGPVIAATLGADARPPAANRDTKPWHPLEFLAAVDASGLVGPPALTSSSGLEDVDNFFRSYLAERFHLGERLTPGFYRIVIGP